MRRRLLLGLLSIVLSACTTARPSVDQEIQAAVELTLQALPTNGASGADLAATATSVPLKGLFCEYEFCIAHPSGMALFDAVAKRNPTSPEASTFDSGDLAAANSSLFIEIKWQSAPEGSDGQFMLDSILEPQVDQKDGDVQAILVRKLSIFYVPIKSSASAALPYGGAAAWTCNGRAFAWKTYVTQPDLAKNLLMDALQVFRCD